MKTCPYCNTSIEEIKETGFAGCAKCYELDAFRTLVKNMYGQKKHKGRGGKNGNL